MQSALIPFRFEITNSLKALAKTGDATISAVQISAPFINIRVHPSPFETELAAKIVVRALNRRVLSASECCDGCINEALNSIQGLRGELVDMRVELANSADGPLFPLLDLMLVAIRQFLTFEQTLSIGGHTREAGDDARFRSAETRQSYFDALELLRGHLSRCLGQVAVIGGMPLPADGLIAGYQGEWPLEAYEPVDVSAMGNGLR